MDKARLNNNVNNMSKAPHFQDMFFAKLLSFNIYFPYGSLHCWRIVYRNTMMSCCGYIIKHSCQATSCSFFIVRVSEWTHVCHNIHQLKV
ncbi:hypothetical protein P9112_003556 [Eukaryota sp. TZLM1-RC]